MSPRRLILIAVIIIVLILGGWLATRFLLAPEEENEGTTAESTLPPVIAGLGEITAEGQVAPLRSVDLAFTVGGIVDESLVIEGDRVTIGDPLLRLEAEIQQIALGQAQAGLEVAEARLASAQAQVDTALAGVSSAELGVIAAQANLALVEAGALPLEIAAAEQEISAAEAGLVQAASDRNATLEIPESQIRAAEAQVARAQAEVDSLDEAYQSILDACFELPTGDEICPLYGPTEERTRSALEVARLNLASAQATLDTLNAGGTAAQRRAAGGAVTVAEVNLALAEAQLDLLLAGPPAEEVRQAELGVEQAEAGVEAARAAVEDAQAALAQAEAGVLNAQSAVDAAQEALNKMTLTAPFDGTIGQVDINPGELASPGVSVVSLADLDGWQVETTDFSELDVASIVVGDTVEVRLDAIPDETIEGTVTDIARVSQEVHGDVTYTVKMLLEARPDLPIRWGMTAEVTFP